MNHSTLKWITFITLFLTVPVLLFMVQVIMIMPAVFLIAGILFVAVKALDPSHLNENMTFILMLAVHLVIYSGLFYLISYITASLISRLRSENYKRAAIISIISILTAITFLPLYGGGGHGPVKLVPLPDYLGEINKSYGVPVSAIVYGGSIIILILMILMNQRGCHSKQLSGPKSSK